MRAGEVIGPEQGLPLAVYIATMLKRVPKSRERAQALIQPALESTVAQVRDEIRAAAQLWLLDPERTASWLIEVDAAYTKFSESPPDAVVAQINDPRPTSAMVLAIMQMTWRWLRPPPGEYFITGDNPAFFHGAYGIGTPHSELRFPLSPELALHGTFTPLGPSDPRTIQVTRDWVREFNRSLASTTARLGFAHRRSSWLGKLMNKRDPYLFRLQWTPAGIAT